MPAAVIRLEHYSDLKGLHWRWRSFSPAEMADRMSGELVVVPAFMDWLQDVRDAYGRPMILTSAYRTPQHQRKLSGKATGAHVEGVAVDVKVCGEDAYHLDRIATEKGVLGKGWHQVGPDHQRFIHLDRWENAPRDRRPRIWTYG